MIARFIRLITLASQVVTGGPANDWGTLDGSPPKLLAHCGERVLMPEHTTGSYEIAAIEGADYVEPDLVLTKDGILVCFHDLAMKRVTDVEDHPEFADRRGNHSAVVDGQLATIYDDWLVIHFTLAELKTLRIKQQPVGIRPQYFNKLFSFATFQEFIDVVHAVSAKEFGRPIGIVPELKHASLQNERFNSTDHFMEKEFLRVLRENGYPLTESDKPNCRGRNHTVEQKITCGPIIFQSFDKPSLKYLAEQTTLPEIMMTVNTDMYQLTAVGIKEIAGFSHYLSLWKELMYTGVEAEIAFRGLQVDQEAVGRLGGFLQPNEFVEVGHKLGLKVAVFTIPDSREHSGRGCALKCEVGMDKRNEMFHYFDMGVDAMFVENIPEAIQIRLEYAKGRRL